MVLAWTWVVHPSEGPTPVATFYDDAVSELLPSVDITRTLAAKLCGRLDDAAFNAAVVAFTRRVHVLAHVAAALSVVTAIAFCLVRDVPMRAVLTGVNIASGLVFFVPTVAAFSWDVLRLIVQTFEFWFLFAMIGMNTLQWCLLYHDTRVAAFAWMGVVFTLTLCIDANIHSRNLAARFFVLAAPALFISVVLAIAHYPPDVNYYTYRIAGIDIDALDLLVNGNLVISYFTATDFYRLRHLVFTHTRASRIQCGMFFPVCHLIQAPFKDASIVASPSERLDATTTSSIQQLQLLQASATRGIDAGLVLSPWLARRIRPLAVNALGWMSHTATILWIATTVSSTQDFYTAMGHPASAVLASVSFASAVIFSLAHISQCQRQLVARLLHELDVWFVSFQMTIVAISMCDLVAWEWYAMLPLFTAWVWGHWAIFLDALPPVTRRRLAYSHRFTRYTMVLLAVYPVALAYTLFFSASGFRDRERVLVRLKLGGVQWKVKLLGFLASKLFTLEVWMLRFFWRELLRPSYAFKLIKRRVGYDVLVN